MLDTISYDYGAKCYGTLTEGFTSKYSLEESAKRLF
jgi:hypothetical protein